MSFKEQERALFDLLFDRNLRERFCKDPATALAGYDLDSAEVRDFAEIRPDALVLDAKMRANLLLSHLCRAFPISFSIASSLPGGLDTLQGLIDAQTMHTAPVERAMEFGKRLRDNLLEYDFDTPKEKTIVITILEAELGMAWTSTTLKQIVMENGAYSTNQSSLPPDWSKQPVRLAAYVSVALIPQPYSQLKRSFCPGDDVDLWRYLSSKPLTASSLRKALKKEDPRLLVARAYASHLSRCDPTINHQTVELAEGFAPLFQHVNGTASVEEILMELKQAGAPGKILEGVHGGFLQLLRNSMLELA